MLFVFLPLLFSPSQCNIPGGFGKELWNVSCSHRAHLNKLVIDSAQLSHTQTGRALWFGP